MILISDAYYKAIFHHLPKGIPFLCFAGMGGAVYFLEGISCYLSVYVIGILFCNFMVYK